MPFTFGVGDEPVYDTLEQCFTATKDGWLDSVAVEFGSLPWKQEQKDYYDSLRYFVGSGSDRGYHLLLAMEDGCAGICERPLFSIRGEDVLPEAPNCVERQATIYEPKWWLVTATALFGVGYQMYLWYRTVISK